MITKMQRVTKLFSIIWFATCPLFGNTALDGALNGSRICDLTQNSDLVGAGLLMLESPDATGMHKQMGEAVRNSTSIQIGTVFSLNANSYFKGDIKDRIQEKMRINYSYNFSPIGSRRPQIYSYYIDHLEDYPKGMQVVFFANKNATNAADIKLMERDDQLSLDDVREVSVISAKPNYESINTEIVQGKSQFALGYAISLIFDNRLAQAQTTDGSLAMSANTDLAQSWLSSLPESLLSFSQKQTLYLSNNIYRRHRPELDDAWINSIPDEIFVFKDDDISSLTYGKYILDLAFNMVENDFKANADKTPYMNSLGYLYSLISNMKNGPLKQEEFPKINKLLPNGRVSL